MPRHPPSKSVANRKARRGAPYSADRLMQAALELFSERDFRTVTIKDIATLSGVNTALIYYYFESKEDLFRAAIEFAIKKALERYSQLRETHTEPVYLIQEWFRSNLEMAHLIRQLVKIMLDYSCTPNSIPTVERLIKEFYLMEEDKILASAIERGIGQGLFRKVEPRKIARFVSVHLDGIIVASIIRRPFDAKKAFGDLQEILWLHLGYESKRRRVGIEQFSGATCS
jgi:AcrR family transcriptional regulator